MTLSIEHLMAWAAHRLSRDEAVAFAGWYYGQFRDDANPTPYEAALVAWRDDDPLVPWVGGETPKRY